MQTFHFDMSIRGVAPVLSAKQGDVGRKFKAVITDSGLAYAIPRGAQFSVWYSGPGGEGNYSAIGENSAFVVNENIVIVELITQMLTNAGTCSMCLVMTGADGSQLGLWNMVVVVEAVPGLGSAAAEQYYTALSEVAEKAVKAAETFQTDTTMTVSGRAADAATVGVMLEGKAPAGYGLGEQDGNYISDCNIATRIGWYSLTGSTLNMPSASFYIGALRVERRGQYITQTAIAYLNEAKRDSSDGGATWNEWEYVNPPMAPGVEYRTTKRHKGKPVYALMLPGGTIAGKSAFSINLSDRNIAEFVDWRCGIGDIAPTPYDLVEWGLGVDIKYKPTPAAIYGFLNWDGACENARFYLEYTKTTD